ncbi:MAG: 2-C-methyl-D-erythritol 4-phosphate cytidylyltransferase [Clostridia bacterium]|nr:2-C-methyl-D-erythritol 4-phosphate cytidylyltransferase [Clostridia bacterium]
MCIKKIVGVCRAISGTPHPKNYTSAIIAAAGLSERFGGDVTKQMTELRGMPLLIHTLKAFEETDCIHEIILVAKINEIPAWEQLCRQYEITKLSCVVQGGYTRQDSVLNGLDAVNKKSKFVAIADGARCLITPEQIKLVCRAAYKYKAATAAHRSTDTVKIADKKGFIDNTADRDTVWLAQTPQVFKTKLYRAAAYTALKKGYKATDDNALVENVGHPIRLVECGAQNIKITTREDIAVAEGILADRERIAKLYADSEADQ